MITSNVPAADVTYPATMTRDGKTVAVWADQVGNLAMGVIGNTQVSWPRFEQAEVIDDGKTLAVLLREFDGTISAVRIPVDRVAD
jgi:hypothetical protein